MSIFYEIEFAKYILPYLASFGRVIPWNQVVNRYLRTTEIGLMRQGTAELMRIVGNRIFRQVLFIVYRWRNGLLGALLWFDQLFAAGRLEQDRPRVGPS